MFIRYCNFHSQVMVMTAGASRKGNQRTTQEEMEIKDSNTDYKILSTDDVDSEQKTSTSDYNYRKFFNESDVKFQNANNYYRRKPNRS